MRLSGNVRIFILMRLSDQGLYQLGNQEKRGKPETTIIESQNDLGWKEP